MKHLTATQEYRMWKALSAVSGGIHEEVLRKYLESGPDISMRHLLVMKRVYEMTEQCPEGIPLKDLSAALALTPGTVSELVESLVRKGALLRVQNPNDRRAVMISVTEKSLETLRAAEERINGIVKRLWQDFKDAEKDALTGLLERLSGQLEEL